MIDADPTPTEQAPTPSGSPSAPARRLPPFSPSRLQRELAIDAALRTAALAGLFFAFFLLLSFGPGSSAMKAVLIVFMILAWLALNVTGAKVAQTLPSLSAVLESNPPAGETALANLMNKRALPRWVRLMLTHRQAVLRHRQQNFTESSAIAQTLLTTPRPGPAAAHRGQLLLLLTEARLELRDATGAWLALVELAHTPLGLTEALQRMALRTRYELLVGQNEETLKGLEHKTQLAELMPAPQCGALHAMLATAAKHAGRDDLHTQLRSRVELMCSEDEIVQMLEGGLLV
ncbi:hypothetical protein [Algisphaera agarilytica]|uniref:Uncharacterized protein n=1 Tax=Algisphaera agarilytica TaxID=1385975 RepID=A0A7X0H518_9BACT|nr:hypothetical protein [Algisphaera agarilytica]MBB6429416.1 hypothetical protein [Algisphaera agarilytica]